MSKKIIYSLAILLTILIGTLLYAHFCCTCCNEKANEENLSLAGNKHNSFSVKGSEFDYSCKSNFNFNLNKHELNQPVNDSIDIGIELIKVHLENKLSQKLIITGFCTPDEKNSTSFPNLGFARADNIKSYFISKGISLDAIDTDGQVRDTLDIIDNLVFGPINFTLKESIVTSTDTINIDLAALKEKLDKNPLILNFSSRRSKIILSDEEKKMVADIIYYLEKIPEAKIEIVGHTDNTGIKKKNIKVGQKRADYVKSFFDKDIDNQRIETSSKGQDEPLADNSTEEGKAKNRRVVISIK